MFVVSKGNSGSCSGHSWPCPKSLNNLMMDLSSNLLLSRLDKLFSCRKLEHSSVPQCTEIMRVEKAKAIFIGQSTRIRSQYEIMFLYLTESHLQMLSSCNTQWTLQSKKLLKWFLQQIFCKTPDIELHLAST